MLLEAHLLAPMSAPFIGSFLGVLVTRLPAGRSIVFGRSACGHCGGVLAIPDLVPLLSWLALHGRCRRCSVSLGGFYPAIECAAVAVALWASFLLTGWILWAGCALGWTLLVLAVIDSRHLLLPDCLTLPLIAAGLLVAAAIDPDLLLPHLVGAAGGYGVFAATSLLYHQVRGREGLGPGDAKLLAAGGAWLSWSALPSVVLIASVAALAMVLVARSLGRRISRDQCVPFGPCICIAVWAVWLYGPLQFT